MADDPTVVLRHLRAFEADLSRSRQVLAEQTAVMAHAVRQLSAVYRGEAADQFMERWRRSERQFHEHDAGMQDLIGVLSARIEALAHADARDAG